jgi:hypothetical protein
LVTQPKKSYFPQTLEQNPAPIILEGQDSIDVKQSLTAEILQTFVELLPSNYVSQTKGPFYITQFQSFAEQLAEIQITMREVGIESDVDFARPEYLWQMVGTYVFPDLTKVPKGIPEISGDLTFRAFLKNMLDLLLKGSTLEAIKQGLELLSDSEIQILAKVDYSHAPTSGWTIENQNEFEINVLNKTTWTDSTGSLIEGEFGTGFPFEVFKLYRNNQRILRALKPSTKLYDYRHLFKDVFGFLSDSVSSTECTWEYEDFRKFCIGIKEIEGISGVSFGTFLFVDSSLFFNQISSWSNLEILSGPNSSPINGGKDDKRFGKHSVDSILRLPFGKEVVSRPYVTFPSNLSGFCSIGDEGVLIDLDQDFSGVIEGETITIQTGPNSGTFRIETLLGPFGGFPEKVSGDPVSSIRVGFCLLKLKSRVVFPASNQRYRVSIERLGEQKPKFVIGENVSNQFFL